MNTIQHHTAQSQGLQDQDDKAEKEKKMLKDRDNILASEVKTFNAKRPDKWITSVQKLLQTNGLLWMEDSKEEKLNKPGITLKLREMLDAAVPLVAKKALTLDTKVRLGVHCKFYPIAQLLEEHTDVYMGRASTRQDECRLVATKIKMRQN